MLRPHTRSMGRERVGFPRVALGQSRHLEELRQICMKVDRQGVFARPSQAWCLRRLALVFWSKSCLRTQTKRYDEPG